MKIFISHTSKDNHLAKKVVSFLEKESTVYWIDFEKIQDGDKIRKLINEGIENASHFLLLWNKNAYDSEWVTEEINGVSHKPYCDNTRMIVFALDDTPLRPLDIDKQYRKVTEETLKLNLENIIQLYSENFKTQLKYYKKTIQEHYNNPPKFPEKPIITNFIKLEKGSKYYVRQKYKNLLNHEHGEDIFNYVTTEVSKKIDEIKKGKEYVKILNQKKKKLQI
ncbi:MAG: toll/interleukin-1 receptor domain-containing protein [Nitrosopumilus sp.]